METSLPSQHKSTFPQEDLACCNFDWNLWPLIPHHVYPVAAHHPFSSSHPLSSRPSSHPLILRPRILRPRILASLAAPCRSASLRLMLCSGTEVGFNRPIGTGCKRSPLLVSVSFEVGTYDEQKLADVAAQVSDEREVVVVASGNHGACVCVLGGGGGCVCVCVCVLLRC